MKIPVTRRIVADTKATCPSCGIESFQVGQATFWNCPYCQYFDVPRAWEKENTKRGAGDQ